MNSHQIHAIVIEDDPDDVLLLKDALADVGMGKIKLDCTDRLSRGLIQLGSQTYDVILLDLNLPDSRGLDTLNTMVRSFPRLPVVVLSGLADDAIVVEAVRSGAQDYLVKGEISGPLLMRVVRYAIERKQVEAVLRASEARYRTLVETSPNGITLADLEGKIILCNLQAVRLHGFSSPESMMGIDVFKLIAPQDRRLAALNTQRTINEGHVMNAEYTLLRRDGTTFPGEISTALVRNSSGAPTGFISMTRDITERRKAIDAETQLVKVEQEFIASISRELRTPLLSLMEYLDLVRSRQMKDAVVQEEFLSHATQDADRLLDLVDELTDFSSLESGKLELTWNRVDMASIVGDVLVSRREQAAARRVTLMVTPIDQGLTAEADARRIRRVVNKLVENAIRASDKGGKVLVTCKPMNNNLALNVVDEGPGMSLEDCERIFDKYFQVSQAEQQDTNKEKNQANEQGIGLGLYVSRQVVEAHGGKLMVSSQLGAGSTFTVILPMHKRKLATDGHR